MRYIKWLVPLFLSVLMMHACEYNKGKDLGPIGPPVSFDTVIKPIIIQNCVKCHSDTSTNTNRPGYAFFIKGASHNDFSELQFYALKPSSNSTYTDMTQRIHGYDGVERMPKFGPYLPDSTMAKIDRWIGHGAPLNN
jgi:hypothetical protein